MDIWLKLQVSATIILVIMVVLDSILNDGNYYPTIGGCYCTGECEKNRVEGDIQNFSKIE